MFSKEKTVVMCGVGSLCYQTGFFGWRGVSLLALWCEIVVTGLYWLWVELQFSSPEMKIDSEGKKSLLLF